MMNGQEKSDSAIVAVKSPNKAGSPVAEAMEPRAGTKGNAEQQYMHRTQSRARMSQSLDRVRKAAGLRKKERLTALFDRPEEVLDVGVCDPVHLPLVDRDVQGIQCIVRSSSGPEPVGETAEVAFIDGIEHHDRCTLNDLPIRLRYKHPA